MIFVMMSLLFSQYGAAIYFDAGTEVVIKKGDTLAKFYAHQSSFAKTMTKLWLRNNRDLIPKLQEGTYVLSGSYTKAELMRSIQQGPTQMDHLRVTVLEGRSMYDIDAELTRKGLITE